MLQSVIAISDCDHQDIREEISVFTKFGIEHRLYQCKTEEDLIRELPGHHAVINQYAPFTDRVFHALPELQMIVRYGVGVNNIDLAAATRHGVVVCNVPDYGVQEVASHAFAMVMALTRKLFPMNSSVKGGRWEYAESIPIRRYNRLTYGVVGLGRIGLCFAEMIHVLGGVVLGYDICPNVDCPSYIQKVDFETLISQSDVISLHCNLETSRNLFDMSVFQRMKPSAYLVNVSRGGIIHEDDLAQALCQGLLAGAGIDVTEQEPLPASSALLYCPNLILTPHMAWYSEEASSDLKTKAAEEACRFICNHPLLYQLNR